jgi:hypothetical protein
MKIIADGICLEYLDFLLEFLAVWEKRPASLTQMAYQWCSAISEAAGRLGPGKLPANSPPWQQLEPLLYPLEPLVLRINLQLRLRPQYIARCGLRSSIAEEEFSAVGPGCDLARMDSVSDHTHICPQGLIPLHYARLLPVILEIGFRLVGPSHDGLVLHLNHTSHHRRVFEFAFSSNDDEVIADAVSVWIIGGDPTPPCSFVGYFAKCMERSRPFSPRLRQVSIRAIESIKYNRLEVSGLETIHLLNCLNVDADDMVDRCVWVRLLAGVICLPAGLESLSPHYWCLLDKLSLGTSFYGTPGLREVEVMRLLEEAGDWEKLEVWMAVVWQSQGHDDLVSITEDELVSTTENDELVSTMENDELVSMMEDDELVSMMEDDEPVSMTEDDELVSMTEDVERVTLELLLQRPSALLRFETLCKEGRLNNLGKLQLRWICDQAQAEQPPSKSPSSLYVSICSAPHLPFLIPPYSSLQSIDSCPTTCSPSFCKRRYFLKLSIIYVMG